MDVKGFYFSMDAMLGAVLIVGALLLLADMTTQEQTTETIDFLSKDLLTSLTEIKIYEINNTVISTMIANGDIDNINNSLLEQIGEFWSQNETILALNFTDALIRGILPQRFGVSLEIGNDVLLYENNSVSDNNLVNSRRMITGFKKGAALTGFTASASMQQIDQKKTSEFAYFGGFVGQGNITQVIRNIPSDVNSSDIIEIFVEAVLGTNTSVYINGNFCTNLSAPSGNNTAGFWDLTGCNSSIIPGSNDFLFEYPGINSAYIGGGFIKVTYLTKVANDFSPGTERYWFPEIIGIVNLYDSFSVPGSINSMTVYLDYFADHTLINNTFFLTIGNSTVYNDFVSTTPQTIFIDNATLSSQLNYSQLSYTSVPIRVGFSNLTFATQYTGAADVMIITDVSGSMERRFDNNNLGIRRNCDDPDLNLSSTTRLSVAKCLDMQFALDIINITGNQIGLVSYEDTTEVAETVSPTINITLINQTIGIATPETGYHADGGTCICCGINTAYDELSVSVLPTVFLSAGSSWKYTVNNFTNIPPVSDGNGTNWTELSYNDTNWISGNAVLGSNEHGIGPLIVTDMGNTLVANASIPELWELAADASTGTVEFDAGLNYTGNTWGESGGANNDGWDSLYGAFGTVGGDVEMNADPNADGNQADNTVAADNEMSVFIGSSWDGSNDDIPDGGAFGLEIYISPSMYNILSSTDGSATLYFDWRLDPSNLDAGEGGWVKAQFGTSSNMTYLGTHMDENASVPDATREVFWCEDDSTTTPNPCPNPGGDTFVEDISNLISGSGWYYLSIGGKATENAGDTTWDESWRFYFNNVYLEVTNNTDTYYLRKAFNISNINLAQRAIINLLSDDKATVYVNNVMVHNGTSTKTSKYWSVGGIPVQAADLVQGENIIAAELSNSRSAAKFDIEFIGFNDSREKVIMVMTDGQANNECVRQNTGTATGDAIQAACDAKEDFGITVYAVGFSDGADETTLQEASICGGGEYTKSSNIDDLQEFYNDVAQSVITAAKQSQLVVVGGGGGYEESSIYSTSYIEINYTSQAPPLGPNEISFVFQTDQFNTCNPSANIFNGVNILEGKVTSYSGDKWTDLVTTNGNVSFNLSSFNRVYATLGDPFVVSILPTHLTTGSNNFFVNTGDNPINGSGCSANNSLIYMASINPASGRSQVVAFANGCHWTIDFETGNQGNLNVPSNYNGTKQCNYTSSSIVYDSSDAYDMAMLEILDKLDLDDDGEIIVDFSDQNMEIEVLTVTGVPYLWGPAIVEAKVWE